MLDFGVAQLTGPDVDGETIATSAGVLLGTIGYMSPEQARGDRDQVDRRTDVHALGAILFELLGGKPAYDVRGRPIHDAVRVVGDEEPSTLASVDRSFRGDLDTIVGRAMEKQPSRRYSSVAELSADLERYLTRQPILARRPSTFSGASRGETPMRIWSVEGGVPVECAGHQGEVTGGAFSPDGTQIATSSRDRTARLWDLDGHELATPRLDRLDRDFTVGEIERFGELLGR